MRASSRPTSRIGSRMGSPTIRTKPLAGAGLGILQAPAEIKQKEEVKSEEKGLWAALKESTIGSQQQDPVARLKLLLVSVSSVTQFVD